METTTKRVNRLRPFGPGEQVLAQSKRRLRTEEDLTAVTIRNDENDWRHCFGSCMAACMPLYRLAQLMGHVSLETTMRSVQATTTEWQQEVERMDWREAASPTPTPERRFPNG